MPLNDEKSTAKIKHGEPTSIEPISPKAALRWGYEFFSDPKLASDRRVMYAYDLKEMQVADIDAILETAHKSPSDMLVAYVVKFKEPVHVAKISSAEDATFVAVPIKLNEHFGDALRAIRGGYNENAEKTRSQMIQFAINLFKDVGLETVNEQIAIGNATIYLAVGTPFEGRTDPAFRSTAAFSAWPTVDR